MGSPASFLGHRFARPELLAEALTHPSWSNEHGGGQSYQRLELLGDALLGLLSCELLLERYPQLLEGELTRRRAAMVQEQGLAWLARQLDLGERLRLGRGEEEHRDSQSLLADALEAVAGALYLDAGFAAARAALRPWLERLAAHGEAADAPQDYKTALQERLQAQGRGTPAYRILDRSGPEHRPRFRVLVALGEQVLAEGEGPSIKEAGQEAARRALESPDARP